MEILMIPFDYDKYLAGYKAVTRDGVEVVVTKLAMSDRDGALFISQRVSDGVRWGTHRSNGVSLVNESLFDLFLVPKKVVKWVNLYKEEGLPDIDGFMWDSQEEADAKAMPSRLGNRAHKIEYEEE